MNASQTQDHSRQGWFDRAKSALRFKASTNVRDDLTQALDNDEGAEIFVPEERAMLSNILSLREVQVDDVMIPRADIDAVEIGTSVHDILAKFRESGHSRMPVFRSTLDDPVGLVHIKDLMAYITGSAAVIAESDAGAETGVSGKQESQVDIDLGKVDLSRSVAEADLVRDILFVPPSMPVPALLASMRAARMHMALVIDEYGGTDGVVSLEDAIEAVVGDIEDEHDEAADAMIVPDGEGGLLADARADLDDVAAAIGVDLASLEKNDDVDTIGGLVQNLIGRIPVRGELITLPGGFELEVLDVDPRRIKRLKIHRRDDGSPKVESSLPSRVNTEPAPDT
jgi:CBS domain containing-hemolysin-like protein